MGAWLRRFLFGQRGVAGGDAARRSIGARGERAAIRFLRTRGIRVVRRNVVLRAGEIDLLCRDAEGVLILVEVKSRTVHEGPAQARTPEASITAEKRHKLLALARDIARREHADPRRVRIDVVAVEFLPDGSQRIRHHPRAVTSRP